MPFKYQPVREQPHKHYVVKIILKDLSGKKIPLRDLSEEKGVTGLLMLKHSWH